MGFDARQETVATLLSNSVYRIPRNQRKYVWNKENWSDLWTDVVFVNENKTQHFIGSIVLKEEDSFNGLNNFTIIDGQQRMMTISLFIIAIMFHLKMNGLKDDFGGCAKYLVTRDRKNKITHIFNTDYHESYENMVDYLIDKDITTLSITSFIKSNTVSIRKDKKLGDAVKYFYDQIKEYIDSQNESLESVLLSVLDSLIGMNYVHIKATTEEDSYTIFEILNARGVPLQDHDLLKNYIMRYIQPVENRDKVKIIWENMENELSRGMPGFIKHYASHKYSTSDELRKEPYKIIRKNSKIEEMSNLLKDIRKKSEYYAKLVSPQLEDEGGLICSDIEYRIFTFFKSNRQEQFRPILLTLMHQYDMDNITKQKYEFMLNFIYKFFLCYIIIGKEKSNKLTDVIYKYAPILENDYSDEILDEFSDSIKSKIPNTVWFSNAFRNIGWSNHWGLYKDSSSKKNVNLILEILEKYLSNKTYIEEFTIEHILPDSQNEENARIGNLIPLEKKLNQKCKDKTIDEKMIIYKESNFITTRNIAERYSRKNDFSIEKRTDYLAKLFYDKILESK